MATYVNKMGYLMVNAVDMTTRIRSCTLNMGAEMQDNTAMTNTTRSSVAGLLTRSIEAELLQDFAASASAGNVPVDATISPLVGAAAFNVAVRPTNSAISATNPEYSGNMVIESYVPIAGNVGDMAIAKVTLRAAGALTRATA